MGFGEDLPVSSTETSAATTTTAAASSSAVPTEPATTTTTKSISVPGTTITLTVDAQPTGLEGALSLKLQRLSDPSPKINDPYGWLELHVQVDIPQPIGRFSSISFRIPPQLTDISTIGTLDGPGSILAARTSFDANTRLFTVHLDNWVTWHKNMKGDFYVMCRFTPEFAGKLALGTYIFEFPVASGGVLTAPLYRTAIDRSALFERQTFMPYEGTTLFTADIEVPSALGPWDWVELQVAQEGDNGFVCDESGAFTGRSTGADNTFRKTRDVTRQSKEVCAVRKFRFKYDSTLRRKDEVLQFRVAGVQGNRLSWTYGIYYALDIMLSNGTAVWWDMTIRKNARTRAAEFYHFTGERA